MLRRLATNKKLLVSSGLPFGGEPIAADDLLLREGPPVLPSPDGEYVPNQIIVKFKLGILSEAEHSLSETLGTDVYRRR